MKFITLPIFAAAAGCLFLTACGSASHTPTHHRPRPSAAVACKDFTDWYLAQGGNVGSLKDAAMLGRAVTAAPSGALYRDLSTLESDSLTTASQKGSLHTADVLVTQEAALSVEQHCQSVNPAG